MTTTAVFAEVLVIGLQAVVWITLALAAFIDPSPAFAAMERWTALATLLILAAAYVLGVVIDRLADSLAKGLVRPNRSPGEGVRSRAARRDILRGGGPLATFLEYQRSRIRLTRGTALNLVIALPIANLFVLRVANADGAVLLAVNAGLLIALVATVYAHGLIRSAHDAWLLGDPFANEADLSERRSEP